MQGEKSKRAAQFCSIALGLVLLFTPFQQARAEDNTAIAFLDALAGVAGMEPSELVATMTGIATVATGGNLIGNASMTMAATLNDNLAALIDAADYPAWNTLTPEEQNIYGTFEEYNASKFNSLMDAFGLGDARDEFYTSSGGNIEWQNDWVDRAEQIGRIGSNWANNGANALSDVMNTVSEPSIVYNFMGIENSAIVDGTRYDDWPTDVPTSVYVNRANNMTLTYETNGNTRYTKVQASNNVYFIVFIRKYSNTQIQYTVTMFDKAPFNYGSSINVSVLPGNINMGSIARIYSYNGEYYYFANIQSTQAGVYETVTSNIQLNFGDSIYSESNLNTIARLLLFSDEINGLGTVTKIPDYPEDISQESGETPIYFPSFIDNSTNWGDYIVQSGGGSSGETVEGLLRSIESLARQIQGSLNAILAKMNVPSDDLFGDFDFGSWYGHVEDLTERVSTLAPFAAFSMIAVLLGIWSGSGALEQAPRMDLPFNFVPGFDGHLVIDMVNFESALPVVHFFCMSMLVLCLVNMSIRVIELEATA